MELEQVDRYFWNKVFSESSKREIAIDRAMSWAQFDYRITTELAPKLVLPKGPPQKRDDPPTRPVKPTKVPKTSDKSSDRPANDDSTVAKAYYLIKGNQKLTPVYQWGYNPDTAGGGGNPDQNSAREERIDKEKAKLALQTGDTGKAKHPPKVTAKAVKEIFYPPNTDGEIYLVDGSNLRILRDGLGLCPPWIILPEKKAPANHFGIQ